MLFEKVYIINITIYNSHEAKFKLLSVINDFFIL